AAASYAVQAEDRALAGAVRRATAYHLNQTQPDHATAQPWALFAFIWNPETRSLADGLLHAQSMHAASDSTGSAPTGGPAAADPEGADTASSPLALMLLADALYCLRLFGV